MEGQYRYSVDRMGYELEQVAKAGIGNVMLFGIPAVKDEKGSQAYAEDGIVQRALREAKASVSGAVLHHGCMHVRVHISRTLRRALRTRRGQ